MRRVFMSPTDHRTKFVNGAGAPSEATAVQKKQVKHLPVSPWKDPNSYYPGCCLRVQLLISTHVGHACQTRSWQTACLL